MSVITKINEEGTRFKSKKATNVSAFIKPGKGTCFGCGQTKDRSLMMKKVFLGSARIFCDDDCVKKMMGKN
jgi:hypothetical protein